MRNENPFDDLEIDPRLSGRELTKRIRKIIEKAPLEARADIQANWEKLTLREDQRVHSALTAHPRPDSASASAIKILRSNIPLPTCGLQTGTATLTRADLIVWNEPSVSIQHLLPKYEQGK